MHLVVREGVALRHQFPGYLLEVAAALRLTPANVIKVGIHRVQARWALLQRSRRQVGRPDPAGHGRPAERQLPADLPIR